MLIKLFRSGKGGGAAPVDYLIASHVLAYDGNRDLIRDDAGVPLMKPRDPLPEVLAGDPDHTRALIDAGIDVHCLRDATRGGLASALVELSATRGLDVHLDETQVPVLDEVRGACELLGLDPLYVANEGRFLAVVAGDQVDAALDVLHRLAPDDGAAHIGSVGVEATRPRVHATGITGVDRILDLLSGEQLPRIC